MLRLDSKSMRGRFAPQFAELQRIHQQRSVGVEQLLDLRPREQEAILRADGEGTLEAAVASRPDRALRTIEARERWLRNFSRELERALDRRLLDRGLSRPDRYGDLVAWTRRTPRACTRCTPSRRRVGR